MIPPIQFAARHVLPQKPSSEVLRQHYGKKAIAVQEQLGKWTVLTGGDRRRHNRAINHSQQSTKRNREYAGRIFECGDRDLHDF